MWIIEVSVYVTISEVSVLLVTELSGWVQVPWKVCKIYMKHS